MLLQKPIRRVNGNVAHVQLDKTGSTWVLRVNPASGFDTVRSAIRSDLKEDAPALGGRHLRLDWGDRALNLLDIRRLSSQLRDEYQASVVAIECSADRIHQYAEHSFKLKLFATGTADPVRMPLGFVAAPSLPEETPVETPVETVALETAVADIEVDTITETTLVIPVEDIEAEWSEESATELCSNLLDEAIPTDLPEAAMLDFQATEIVDVEFVMPEDTEGDEVVAAAAGRRVLVLERTVRSGNVVRFAGDVTIFGDVNAGAHIEADGNIIVLGALRGLAHAGARGDENALIIAFELDAPQLRIARNFGLSEETEPPASLLDAPASLRGRIPVGQLAQLLRRDRVETRQYHPKIVWIQHGTIHIETYDGRLPI